MSLPKLSDIKNIPIETDGSETMEITQAMLDQRFHLSLRHEKTVNRLIERICDHYYIYGENRSRFQTWAAPIRDAICRDALHFDEPEYTRGSWVGASDMRGRRPMYHNIRRVVLEMMKDIPEASGGYEVENHLGLMKSICEQCRAIHKHWQKLLFKAELSGDESVIVL